MYAYVYTRVFLLVGCNGAGRDGDQVQGQDEGPSEEGRPLQLEEDGQDGD